jgi:peptidoglycan/xylan/chitin deacetylase (PgdA/CDA1 family)
MRRPSGCAVALTFDFDAESSWLASGVSSPAALSRGSYGADEGMPRVLNLLEAFSIPATFFVPGDTARRHPNMTSRIIERGHEIGHHGDVHEAPQHLGPGEERAVMERGLEALARHNIKPIGYRSPGGEITEETFPLLLEYGFVYDSSLVGRDSPYWIDLSARRRALVEVPFAWELTDSAHFLFAFGPTYMAGMSAPSKVEEIWWGDFEGAHQEGGVFVLTMHPEIIGRRHRIRLLERTISHMLEFQDVRFLRMREVADAFRAEAKAL